MAKNAGSEKDFINQMVSRSGKATGSTSEVPAPAPAGRSMKLNRPPTGPKISTDQLYEQEQARDQGRTVDEGKLSNSGDAAMEKLPSLDVVRKIPLHLILDSPYQPRLIYDPMGLDALGETLLAAGQVEPITVRMVGDKYELLGGHRRTRAARNIGWTEIEAHIKECDDTQAEKIALLQNEGREDLSEYERAKMYKRAQERGFATTQAEIAKLFGCTQGTVSNCLKLLALPVEIKALLETTPSLVGTKLSRVLFELLEQHPQEIPLMLEGLARIAGGAESGSFKNWFLMKIASRSRSGSKKDKAVVTSASGRTLFSSTIEKGKIQIKLADGLSVDADTVQKWILAILRERAPQAYSD